MNKKELIKVVADKLEMTQKAAGEVVDALFDAITETLAEGNDVSIFGFGKFEIRGVEERTVRNPQDGSDVVVPAHNKVAFKASSALKEAVK